MNTFVNNTSPAAADPNKNAGKKVTAWFNKRQFEYVVTNDVQVQKKAGYIATFYPGTMTIKIELEY